jgi:DNA-binding MarR family transcriptional regulator
LPRGSVKADKIAALISAFRTSGNLDRAFDNRAAEALGVNRTDLHCLNIVQNRGGVTAGALAAEAGLTTGAVTGVVDRLERAGYARRVPDAVDRRRVNIEVTDRFYADADAIWHPLAADWHAELARRFSGDQLDLMTEFLDVTNELTRRHLERISASAERAPTADPSERAARSRSARPARG